MVDFYHFIFIGQLTHIEIFQSLAIMQVRRYWCSVSRRRLEVSFRYFTGRSVYLFQIDCIVFSDHLRFVTCGRVVQINVVDKTEIKAML
jgi:hypothetical protein